MSILLREPEEAALQNYDLIIIGAGIYGITLAMQASAMGLKNLLLDKDDFGGSTTYNSLRTVHGGLRYLQSLDLPRFFESVQERHWFLKQFPGLVTPLPCLMPLYGNGPYRPSVFRVALSLNDLLSCRRNRGISQEQELPCGRVASPAEVEQLFHKVDRTGLKGGAIWYDGAMPSSQLLNMEILKRACTGDTTALNYMEAEELLVDNNQVTGLLCRDGLSGQIHEFRAKRVINAAGPACRSFAASFDQDDPELFRYSIAWNVLFNQPALSEHSLAIKPKRPGARMYFVHGFNGQIMAGTVHAPWSADKPPMPSEEDVITFIEDLKLAVPGLQLDKSDVLQIYAGLLPAREQGTEQLAVREVIKDHGAQGGPQGAYSVSGVKFTTARLVAEKTLRQIFPKHRITAKQGRIKDTPANLAGLFPYNWTPTPNQKGWQESLKSIIEEESVFHLEDLMIRRTSLGDNPLRAMAIASQVADLFPWDEKKKQREIEQLRAFFLRRTIAPHHFQEPLQ